MHFLVHSRCGWVWFGNRCRDQVREFITSVKALITSSLMQIIREDGFILQRLHMWDFRLFFLWKFFSWIIGVYVCANWTGFYRNLELDLRVWGRARMMACSWVACLICIPLILSFYPRFGVCLDLAFSCIWNWNYVVIKEGF